MNYGSVCDGIGGSSVAWQPLGWRCAFRAEIDPFCRAVTKHRFPDDPQLGDFTKIGSDDAGPVDVLAGGTPCQSFSIAGKRLGMDDPRGNLALEFVALAARLRPRWLVFENVPGLMSNFSGAEHAARQVREGPVGGQADGEENRDFAAFLAAVRECGYLGCYRRLDAQFAGLAQRRERLLFVGYLGDWRPPAAVLFEPESLSGHPAPRRETGADVADPLTASFAKHGRRTAGNNGAAINLVTGTLSARASGGGGLGTDFECDGGLVPILEVGKGTSSRGDGPNGCGIGQHGDPMFTLQAGAQHAVAFTAKDHGADATTELSPTLRSGDYDKSHANGRPDVHQGQSTHITQTVRRLVPEEAEALQGYPRGYTRVPYRGKPADKCPEGPRYRALGNAFAVPDFRWIGERIGMVDSILRTVERAA